MLRRRTKPANAKSANAKSANAKRSVTFGLDRLETPIGVALLVTDAEGVLRALDWEDYAPRMKDLLRLHHGAVSLNEAPAPKAMRAALPKIPAGTTMSYGALAARLDMPNAMRAVGHANGSNPISVVVPCHRLIGADGSLVKYGGGLERKRWLLRHEGVVI